MREHNQDDQSGGKLSRHQVRGKSEKAQSKELKMMLRPGQVKGASRRRSALVQLGRRFSAHPVDALWMSMMFFSS